MKKFAVITGATKGIGRAVAYYFAGKGYHLVLLARDIASLNLIARDIEKQHDKISISVYSVDLSLPQAAYDAIKAIITPLPSIDVLFNNAGLLIPGADECEFSDFKQMLNLNVEGMFSVAKACLEKMVVQKYGYIFNLSSLSGIRAFPETALYAATKFAVTGLSEGLYKKYKSEGITVTCLCPGMVATDMTRNFNFKDEDKIQVEDIVKTVDYVLSLSPQATVPLIEIHCREFG